MLLETPSTEAACGRLPKSFQRLIQLIEHQTRLSPEIAKQCLEEAQIGVQDVLPWADFGHDLSDGYGRRLVHDGGFYEIMVMSWVPGDMSAIHDHGTAQWGAVLSLGEAEHAVFERVGDRLRTRLRNAFSFGQINPVTHDLIHQMGNLDQTPFCSVHLYGSYDHQGNITGDSRIWDLFENSIQRTTGGVFFCLPENQINRREPGVAADYPTTMRHHVEMLKRVRLMLPGQPDRRALIDKARRLAALLMAPADQGWFERETAALMDANGRPRDLGRWRGFWHEIQVTAAYKATAVEAGFFEF